MGFIELFSLFKINISTIKYYSNFDFKNSSHLISNLRFAIFSALSASAK